eukprot:scaffold2704_cov94-Skeletonema_dohrnii-CCMP3373.AAC.3
MPPTVSPLIKSIEPSFIHYALTNFSGGSAAEDITLSTTTTAKTGKSPSAQPRRSQEIGEVLFGKRREQTSRKKGVPTTCLAKVAPAFILSRSHIMYVCMWLSKVVVQLIAATKEGLSLCCRRQKSQPDEVMVRKRREDRRE